MYLEISIKTLQINEGPRILALFFDKFYLHIESLKVTIHDNDKPVSLTNTLGATGASATGATGGSATGASATGATGGRATNPQPAAAGEAALDEGCSQGFTTCPGQLHYCCLAIY